MAALEAPAAAEYLPATHPTHAAADDCPCCAEWVPAAHGWHTLAPVVSEYVPAPQSRHKEASILYFPAAHAEQSPSFCLGYPTLHWQLLGEELPAIEDEAVGHATQAVAAVAPTSTEYVPAAQLRHAEAPVAFLYFPASHVMHVPPFGPVYPRLQRQPVIAWDVSVCPEFTGQSWQTDP